MGRWSLQQSGCTELQLSKNKYMSHGLMAAARRVHGVLCSNYIHASYCCDHYRHTHDVLTHWCARDKRSRDNPPEATAPRARSAARAEHLLSDIGSYVAGINSEAALAAVVKCTAPANDSPGVYMMRVSIGRT